MSRSAAILCSVAVALMAGGVAATTCSVAKAGYVVGIEFVSEPVRSPLLSPIDLGPNVLPYAFTDPATSFAAGGALTGYTEADVRRGIVAAVQDIFRDAQINVDGRMLNVSIVEGPVDAGVGTVHLIGDAQPDQSTRFGLSYLEGANIRPDLNANPVYTNALSVTMADTVARIPELSPGLRFDTFEQVVQSIAGTASQEIAHTLGVWRDVPGEPVDGVYPIMASGVTGLPYEARLQERQFLDIAATQPDPPPNGPAESSVTDVLRGNTGTTLVADFNFDGAADLSDFNIWNANKFTEGTGIKRGDADGDGSTDIADFNWWNAQKFTLADGVAGNGILDVQYDPVDGRLTIDTDGVDLLSLIIPGPEADQIDRWMADTFQDGAFWAQAYFNGKQQWAAVGGGIDDGAYHIATYAPGLTAADFGPVVFATPQGEVLRTMVQVPEPGSMVLLAMAFVGWLAWCRRWRRHPAVS